MIFGLALLYLDRIKIYIMQSGYPFFVLRKFMPILLSTIMLRHSTDTVN